MYYCKLLLGLTLFSYFLVVRTFSPLNQEGLWPLWRLDVIHYNDFHARFEETSLSSSICRSNDNDCLGGFPRLYAAIMSLLQEKPNAVLLNAGDSFQGTYWYTLLKWNITQKFMNLLPHDAHAIGNHEFDDGPAGLAPYLSHVKAPFLSANIDTSKEPSLHGLFKSHIVVERNGRKIGIIGVTTVTTKLLSSPGNIEFEDERVAAQIEAKILTEQGVDIIVLLSHAGLDVDREIAADYGDNIDLIVGGHSHSLMWNGPAPSGEPVAGPYPIIVPSKNNSNHKVLIVQASSFSKYMGNLSVYFDNLGEFHTWDGGPIFLNRSHVEDNKIKEMLAPYAVLVHEAEKTVLGSTDVALDKEPCEYGDCEIGNVYCDAMLQYVQKHKPFHLPDISIITSRTIYASIKKGNITAGAIFEAFPYRDRIKTFLLKGRYLEEVIEHSVAEPYGYKPFKSHNVPHFSGMKVTVNVSLPAHQRVLSVDVLANKTYRPLDPEEYVRVTGPAFIVDGGQGFTMFPLYRIGTNLLGYETDILEEHIARHSPISSRSALRRRLTVLE